MKREIAKGFLGDALGAVAEITTGKPFHVELVGPRVEIRCCCNPTKLYGTLPLNGEPRVGQKFRYAPRIVDGRRVFEALDEDPKWGPREVVVLEVAPLTLGCQISDDVRTLGRYPLGDDGQRYLALKYHGDDVDFREKLRRLVGLPGFEPSPEARAMLWDWDRP